MSSCSVLCALLVCVDFNPLYAGRQDVCAVLVSKGVDVNLLDNAGQVSASPVCVQACGHVLSFAILDFASVMMLPGCFAESVISQSCLKRRYFLQCGHFLKKCIQPIGLLTGQWRELCSSD